MNVRRFTARTSRDALVLVRQALGEDAVVLSTKPCAEGVEVLAMAPEAMRQVEKMAAKAPVEKPQAAASKSFAARAVARIEPTLASNPVEEDVAELSMSTLSFQDYVRERMLRRRQASLAADARREPKAEASDPAAAKTPADRASVLEQRMNERHASPVIGAHTFRDSPSREAAGRPDLPRDVRREPPVLRDAVTMREAVSLGAGAHSRDVAQRDVSPREFAQRDLSVRDPSPRGISAREVYPREASQERFPQETCTSRAWPMPRATAMPSLMPPMPPMPTCPWNARSRPPCHWLIR